MREFKCQIQLGFRHFLLNPFYIYALAFLGAIAFYLLHWVDYPQMQSSVLLFLLGSIIVALLLGLHRIKEKESKRVMIDHDRLWQWFLWTTAFLALCVALTLWYAGHVPLFKILLSDDVYNYRYDFRPIKYFTILVTTLISAHTILFSFLVLKYKAYKYLYLIISNFLVLALFGSRGLIMVAFLPLLVVFLYELKLTPQRIILFCVLILALMYLFGVYGDLREGAKTRTDYSLYEDEHSENYPSFLPSKFIWVYYYYTSPIVKFHYVVEDPDRVQENDYKTMFFTEMLPYSIARRLYSDYDVKLRHSEHGFASFYVGTAYDDVFLYARWKGVFLYFVYFFTFLFVSTLLAKRYFSIFQLPIMAIVVTISLLSVFDNMLCFSPIIFQLFWMFVLAFVILKFFVKKEMK